MGGALRWYVGGVAAVGVVLGTAGQQLLSTATNQGTGDTYKTIMEASVKGEWLVAELGARLASRTYDARCEDLLGEMNRLCSVIMTAIE
jgi:hypothetical protein